MPEHNTVTGANAVHPFSYISDTDPGAVGAGKCWTDTHTSPPFQIYMRNAANSAWQRVGSGFVPACRFTLGSNQSIGSGTATALAPTTEAYDLDSQHFSAIAAISGTVTKTASSTTLTGVGTAFTTSVSVGQVIVVPGTANEARVVTVIGSNTSLTVSLAFVNSSSGQTCTPLASPIVMRTAGIYMVMGGVQWASANASILQIRKNGIDIIAESAPSFGSGASAQVVAPYTFSQWDYVEFMLTQSSGGALNALANDRTFFAAHYLGS